MGLFVLRERDTERLRQRSLTIVILHEDLLGEEVAEVGLQTAVHFVHQRLHQWVVPQVLAEHDQEVADRHVRLRNNTLG